MGETINIIENKIDTYNNVISKLQELLSDKKRELLEVRMQNLKNSEDLCCSYKESFLYRYLGFFPYFKNKYKSLENQYRSCSEKFRHQICANLSIIRDFEKLDYVRRVLHISNAMECFESPPFILPYGYCVRISKNYYDDLNKLLEQSREKLNEFRDSVVDTWGCELSNEVVSSLKVIVRVLNLSEIKYESLVSLRDKTSTDLRSLKEKEKEIVVELLKTMKNFSRLTKLSKESFVDHNEDSYKKWHNQFKDVNDANSKISTLISEKRKNESEQVDLSSLVSHLKFVSEVMPRDFPSLNFCDWQNVKDSKHHSKLEQKLDVRHLRKISDTCSILHNSWHKVIDSKKIDIRSESINTIPAAPYKSGNEHRTAL